VNINVSFDSSVNGAPAGFVTAVNYVVNYFDALFTNPVTINIAVGYGEIDGQPLDPNALGESQSGGQAGSVSVDGEDVYLEDYSQTRSALLAQNALGSSTLPASSPAAGSLAMTSAQAKALGFNPNNTGVDGWVGFDATPGDFSYSTDTTPPNSEYYFVGVVEHEFTEVMGRVSFLDSAPNYYSLMDLFRYSAPGVRVLDPVSFAYFSTNGGLSQFNQFNSTGTGVSGDLGDWVSSSFLYDAFNVSAHPGVINALTGSDEYLMETLGWTTPTVPVIVLSATAQQAVQGGAAVALLSGPATIANPRAGAEFSARIQITNGSGNPVAGDQLYFDGLQSGTLSGGVNPGGPIGINWDSSTDTLFLGGLEADTTWDQLLQLVTYQDLSTDLAGGSHPVRTVTWTLNDNSGPNSAFSTTSQITIQSDDYRNTYNDTSLPLGSVSVGGSATGSIDYAGDKDIFAVTLTGGTSYRFDLEGSHTSGFTLADPYLRLLDGSGNVLATNDDIGNGNWSSEIANFAALTSGTYYLEASFSPFNNVSAKTGTYRVDVTSTTPVPPPQDDYRNTITDTSLPLGTVSVGGSTTGSIDYAGDKDIFAVTLTGGTSYRFDLEGSHTSGFTLADPYLRLLDGSGNVLATNDDIGNGNWSSEIANFTASSTGTYYLEASFSPFNNVSAKTGTYRVDVTSTPQDDYRNTIADMSLPLGTVSVGGSTTGSIDYTGDKDIFAVALTVGTSYRFDLEGSHTSGFTLADPYLRLLDGSGNVLATNDDIGNGNWSSEIANFTASTTGTYYLEASFSPANNVSPTTGTYRLDALVQM
jgi:hypothetical protein